MKNRLVIMVVILLLAIAFNYCASSKYLWYKAVRNVGIVEISQDSILYFYPQKCSMKVAKGKLKKLDKKQLVFISEFNIDSADIFVNEDTKTSNLRYFNMKNSNNYLGKFGAYGYVDEYNKFTLVINNKDRYEIRDSLALMYYNDIKSLYIEYETFRPVDNNILKTKEYYVKNKNANYFNIETDFSDYFVYAEKRIDTLEFLPFYRLKINDMVFRRVFNVKESQLFHDRFVY
ncbi:MAG: hypothetical protein HN704_11645 [Bacteroidetes bacterium]|nr:hypothetical protein [Bacteroidota bacterium]MBT6685228.1 hypothetical protein [Bacteroidota bacterium]MBT7142296.1 hypothetical protein [Bacteroidota bacterium]MBT7492246.1 hypothetical protein [Bacteroidota bacterium]